MLLKLMTNVFSIINLKATKINLILENLFYLQECVMIDVIKGDKLVLVATAL